MKRVLSFLFALMLALGAGLPASAAPKKEFNIAWTIYVGWMPWPYAAEAGIVKKWADKYGITIDVTQINDYVESINQYTAGKFDGVTRHQHGRADDPGRRRRRHHRHDHRRLLQRQRRHRAEEGQDRSPTSRASKINMVELSVSHYLLARGASTGRSCKRDATSRSSTRRTPISSRAFKSPDSHRGGDLESAAAGGQGASPAPRWCSTPARSPARSSTSWCVNTETLKDNPNFGKALVGIWYETIALMTDTGEKGKAAREAMAKLSGTDLAGFEAQLKTTRMFYTPTEAVAFTTSADLLQDHGPGAHLLLRPQPARREA